MTDHQLAPAVHQERTEPTYLVELRERVWNARDVLRVFDHWRETLPKSSYFAHTDGMRFLMLLKELPVGAPARAAEWQPIETAPKDGSRIVLYVPKEGMNEALIAPAVWHSGEDEDGPFVFWSYGIGFLTHVAPTHWQPLPLPPGALAGQPNKDK